MPAPMDLMVELKELALASRMKRLSEALMKDAAGFYEALGVDFQPRWFPVFYALTRRSPMPIGEIAHHLRLSHPAVGQVAEPMRRAGLVRCSRDRRDERKRLLSLTPAGLRLQRRLEPIWAEVRAAARELVDEAGVDLLADIAGVEAAVARHSVMDRVRRRLGMTARGELRIVDYRPAYKKCFRALNEEWLRDGFSIEPHDARVLEDPNGAILRHGGTILFALLDDEVVGTAALIRHPGEILELGKLAVASRARRRGIGTALARAVITRARDRGANAVYLRTSPRLKDAIRFYRRVGFRARATSPLPRAPYRRRSITMALTLEPGPRCRGREVSR